MTEQRPEFEEPGQMISSPVGQSRDLSIRQPAEPMELSVDALTAQAIKVQEVMRAVMKEGLHYGVIPGTDKPTLFKAGAEKLCFVFRLSPGFAIRRDDMPGGHREYTITCTLTHIPTGRVMAQGVGSCSTMEKKYRYRLGEAESTGNPVPREYWDLRKVDPAAAQETLGGKGFMPKKIDGAWLICKKSDEHIENPDIADTYNTVLKMAKKRAFVDTTITGTAASDCLNQDLEDLEGFAEKMSHPAAPQPAPVAPKRPVHPQPKSGGTKTFPPPAPPITLRQQELLLALSPKQALWNALKSYTNGDQKAAGQICNELTGFTFYTSVPDDAAVKALAQFREDYLAQEPVSKDIDINEGDLPF